LFCFDAAALKLIKRGYLKFLDFDHSFKTGLHLVRPVFYLLSQAKTHKVVSSLANGPIAVQAIALCTARTPETPRKARALASEHATERLLHLNPLQTSP